MEEFITPLSFSRFEEELESVMSVPLIEHWVSKYVDVVVENMSVDPGKIKMAVSGIIFDFPGSVKASTETRLRQFLMTLQVATDALLLSGKRMRWLSDSVRAELRLFEGKDVYQLSSKQVLNETYTLLATAHPETVYILFHCAIYIQVAIDESCQSKVLKALADWFENREWKDLSVILNWMMQEDGEDDAGLAAYYEEYSLSELTDLLREPLRHELHMALKVESMTGVKRTIYLNRKKLEVSPGQTFESLENMIDFLSRVFPAQDVQK